MKTMTKMLAALSLVAAAMSGLSVASAAPTTARATGVAAVLAGLERAGVDTTRAIVQTGLRNYAGPNCPGAGWTCTNRTDRPVVQYAPEGGQNSYECSGTVGAEGASCTVSQTSTAGANNARCVLSSDRNPIVQTCTVFQDNQTGSNAATVTQSANQRAAATVATQIARVSQTNQSGPNSLTTGQTTSQSAHANDIAVVEQSQAADQRLAVRQVSATGTNTVAANQSMTMRINSNGGTRVRQNQNASAGEPNQRFALTQRSGSGANDGDVVQKIDQQTVANQSPRDTMQQQGTEAGGQDGSVRQVSDGYSDFDVSQTERQHAVANHGAVQRQFGPHICCNVTDETGDPRDSGTWPFAAPSSAGRSQGRSASEPPSSTALNQEPNPNNTLTLVQTTDQNAAAQAVQDDLALGTFSTSGHGTVDQSTNQNGAVNSNSCSGSMCVEQQSCINGTCDSVAPDTSIDGAPAATTSSRTATFSFNSTEANSTFACSLDGSAFAGCTSPMTYSGLSDGTHTFVVKATDAAGNTDGSPAAHTWTVDTAAPETTITSAPSSLTNSSSATFAFTSTEAGSTFRCSLDGGDFTACESPVAYSELGDGSHTFAVQASDALGNTDASPATHSWTVDTAAPETSIDAGPPALTADPNAAFHFTASEGGATFECSLDGGAFAACVSPALYGPLADGSHTFRVRATDAAGNVDASPASRTWTIDTAAPDTTITSSPTSPTNASSATFAFTASEAGSTFECSLDGAAFTACSSPRALSGLSEGSHTFRVRAVDAAGNRDGSPASHTWTVDLTGPASDFDPGQNGITIRAVTGPSITGTATDALSGLASVKVTFHHTTLSRTTVVDATLACNATRTACTWSARIPAELGSYTATKQATDRAGNVDSDPETISFTVIP